MIDKLIAPVTGLLDKFISDADEKQHRQNHRQLDAIREQSLDLAKAYDRFGGATKATKPQGANVNIEV